MRGATIRQASILVIEKDDTIAEKASVALKEAGYIVVRVADALDGLKKVYELRPDLIIAGWELPMVNGEDACLRIRQASYLPILVLGNKDEAVETLELGIDAYLIKPLSLSELVARVHALLRRKIGFSPLEDSTSNNIEHPLPEEELAA